MSMERRAFLAGVGGMLSVPAAIAVGANAEEPNCRLEQSSLASPSIQENEQPAGQCASTRAFNGSYQGANLSEIAFPMGGLGAGMICLEGSGALSKFSLRHRPELDREPIVFAAVAIKGSGKKARILQGPVPAWKLRPRFPLESYWLTKCWGLPRFRQAEFEARFPFATVHISDEEMPLEVTLTGWSPFSPGDADNASLPVAGLEYRFVNRTSDRIDAVFSFNSENVMTEPGDLIGTSNAPADSARILSMAGGFILRGAGAKDHPWDAGDCAIWVDDAGAMVNPVWFRSGTADVSRTLLILWNEIESGACYTREPSTGAPSPGATVFVPFSIAPGEDRTIVVHMAWYVPKSNLFRPETTFKDGQPVPQDRPAETYQPWYAGRFGSIGEVVSYWDNHYQILKQAARQFSSAFYNSTLPPEVLEAVAANLCILKSPTVLRQIDGRLWGFEGCSESTGFADLGTDSVWNYAQAIAHLFPSLERTLREIELGENQNDVGQQCWGAALPIRRIDPKTQAFSGPEQPLGSVLKAYRDWRISGDTDWLRRWWAKIRLCLDYCIKTWDPQRRGMLIEPHGDNYDTQLWGADSMCTSLYLGALKAATLMGEALKEPSHLYSDLLGRGTHRAEQELYNGEYFFQHTDWKSLRVPFPPKEPLDYSTQQYNFSDSSEGIELAKSQGPTGQWGPGCLADGVHGEWLCLVSGISRVLDPAKVTSHLTAVHRYNFKADLHDNVNSSRAQFACGNESGLLLCTWPRGGKPSLPATDVQEVWTGVEHEIASHLIALGKMEEGLDIVRACRRRYDGRVRNPFAEVEWGHWYCRALSSYALLQSFGGARFDAVEKVMYLEPVIKGDFRSFISTATGFGTVGVRNGKPFVEVVSGYIPYTKIKYQEV